MIFFGESGAITIFEINFKLIFGRPSLTKMSLFIHFVYTIIYLDINNSTIVFINIMQIYDSNRNMKIKELYKSYNSIIEVL